MQGAIQKFILLLVLFTVAVSNCIACSMCKVTINGHTYLGNNEDSWRMGSRIWFENGTSGKLGSVFVGYSDLPQGGMNEAGLAFDGLTTTPKPIRNDPAKKEITNPGDYLKEIMQTCKTVDDVKRFAVLYNRQKFFNSGEYLFADRTGNYLVMESDTLISGNEDKYLIANFCPSITSEAQKQSFTRYKRGEIFLKNHLNDTNSNFAFALTDTMHECRKRIGDGTMYSFVANLDKTEFTLYFYHDFKQSITFNLERELAKGDHMFQIPELFPGNKEYENFTRYKTPRNNTVMLLLLFLGGVVFAFSVLFFAISGFRKPKINKEGGITRNVKFILALVNVCLLYYVFVLYKNEQIFYFPAPYKDFQFSMLDVAAYIPFALLGLMVPLIIWNVNAFTSSSWSGLAKGVFTLNNFLFLTFITLFCYWGLYDIF